MYYCEEEDRLYEDDELDYRSGSYESYYGISGLFSNTTPMENLVVPGTDYEPYEVDERDVIKLYNELSSKHFGLKKEYAKLKKDYIKESEVLKEFSNDSYKTENEYLNKISDLEYEIKLLKELNEANEKVVKWLRENENK